MFYRWACVDRSAEVSLIDRDVQFIYNPENSSLVMTGKSGGVWGEKGYLL